MTKLKHLLTVKDLAASVSDVTKAASIFRKYGAVVLKNCSGFSSVASSANTAATQVLEEYIAIARSKPSGLGLKKENGYRELINKDVGRYDLNVDHLFKPSDQILPSQLRRELSDSELELQRIGLKYQERILPTLQQLLDPNPLVNGVGFVISHPGTAAQGWHVDSSPLYPHTQMHVHHPPPPHFCTVLCPLYPYSEEIGPTEIVTGSQRYTDVLNGRTIEDQYPDHDTVQKIVDRSDVQIVKAECEPGDIVIMNGLTLHRGGANVSGVARPLLYFTMAKPWYREYPATYINRSLFE